MFIPISLMRQPRQRDLWLPGGSVVKNLAAKAGEAGLIPAWGRSLEKEMATHCSVPAWEARGQRRLEGYSPQSHEELDMTEVT